MNLLHLEIFLLALLGMLVPIMIQAKKHGVLLKGLCSSLFLFMGLIASWGHFSVCQIWVLAGMTLGLTGDVILHISAEAPYFLSGTGAFLLGQVCYTVAFSHGFPITFSTLFAVLLLAGLYVLLGAKMGAHPGKLLPAISVYILAIAFMVITAWSWAIASQNWFLLAGATLFMLSDTVLAYGKFIKPLSNGDAWCLGSYYMGQGLIAISVIFFP